jgi:hypothetical protein
MHRPELIKPLVGGDVDVACTGVVGGGGAVARIREIWVGVRGEMADSDGGEERGTAESREEKIADSGTGGRDEFGGGAGPPEESITDGGTRRRMESSGGRRWNCRSRSRIRSRRRESGRIGRDSRSGWRRETGGCRRIWAGH